MAKGQADPVDVVSLTRELLDTNKCYLLDCGLEVYVWMGRNTSLDDRKSASGVAEVLHYSICLVKLLNLGVYSPSSIYCCSRSIGINQ